MVIVGAMSTPCTPENQRPLLEQPGERIISIEQQLDNLRQKLTLTDDQKRRFVGLLTEIEKVENQISALQCLSSAVDRANEDR